MSYLRKECVICESNTFIDCFDIINTINIVEDIDIKFNNNEIKNLIFKGCKNCGCVQLENLFDPNDIYAQASHYTSGAIWNDHNNNFINFISKNVQKSNNIIEVGGGSGRLYDLLIEKITSISEYKILEIETDSIDTNKNVEYINGYCETFDFNKGKINTIIMSHVFEHLYKPSEFLKNICNSNINEVFISIPDMENLMYKKDYNFLHIQHTFYVDTLYITYLFNKYNFKLKNYSNFNKNSNFYYFVRTDKKDKILFKNNSLINKLRSFYEIFKTNLKNLIINKPFYICPSGFYGKMVYHYLNDDSKKNIIGFLDEDLNKVNKRLSGTKCKIFKKEVIKNLNNVNILIIAEKYKEEIKSELNKYNSNIKFISLNSNYTKINNCLICGYKLDKNFFSKDLSIPIGLYCIENEEDNISIPYNIVTCQYCNTIQNRYLGNLDLVYKYGHNEGTGKIYDKMHHIFFNLILENKNIKNILEVGCSVGILSDLIIKNTDKIFYTIVEPNIKLPNNNRRMVYNDFIENIDKFILNKNDTLILSHVLEHFYEPRKVLDKLLIETNINHFYLAWPDLDHYINNNIVNLLTVEHIFYISTNYLEKIVNNYGFKLRIKKKFNNHTIFFYFERTQDIICNSVIKDFDNSTLLYNYINNIKSNLKKINNLILENMNKDIYLWPCSTHNITMLIYDDVLIDKIKAFLDNSPNKINKTVIQFNKKCLSFNDIDKDNSIVILNGGPFNQELIDSCKKSNINYFVL